MCYNIAMMTLTFLLTVTYEKAMRLLSEAVILLYSCFRSGLLWQAAGMGLLTVMIFFLPALWISWRIAGKRCRGERAGGIRKGILSVLLVPELELAFFYVFVIGYYPVLRQALARIKSTLLRWIIKFAVFNGATVLVYALLFALLRKVVLQIPLLILLNRFFPPYGIAYAELIAELFLAVVALITLRKIFRQLDRKSAEAKQEVQP